MELATIVLNIAYAIYVASAVVKKLFVLRIVLLFATAGFIVYGIVDEIWSLVGWNILFGGGHLWQLIKMIQERRNVDLDDEADAIRTLLFNDLDPVLFNRFWHLGNEIHPSDGQLLIKQGSADANLFLMLDGTIEITPAPTGYAAIHLGPLRFAGEMSNVSGDSANANVTARGRVRARAWDRSDLEALRSDEPEINSALVHAISRDVVRKLA